MKKNIFCLGLILAYAGISYSAGRNFTIYSDIGPAVSSSNVVIAAPGAGKYNCLTDLTVISDAAYTLNVVSGATTSYTLIMAANSGVVKEWDLDKAFCVAVNTTTHINVSAGTFQINYQGFVRQ